MRRLALLALGPLFVALASCSATSASPTSSRSPAVTSIHLPAELLGLRVARENIQNQLEGLRGTYLESVGLFSFRERSNLLRATLQVGVFNRLAQSKRDAFRRSIVAQLGGSVPVALRMGHTRVYLSAGIEQNIFAWFDDKGFYVLSVRGDYPFPRTLLRDLIMMKIIR